MANANKTEQEYVNIKINATILALKLVDENAKDSQKTVEDRRIAKTELKVCMAKLPSLESRYMRALENELLFTKAKD